MSRAEPQLDEKTGRWYFRVDLPPAPDGSRRQTTRRGFRTKKAAGDALDKLRTSKQDGTFVVPDTITVREYMERWLEGLQVSGKRPTTIVSYRERLTLHVLPKIGYRKLQALTALDLDRVYSELLAGGRCDGKGGLSSATVRYTHAILSKALADAEKKGLILKSPARAATAPSARASRAPEMAFWTAEEMRTFLAYLTATDDPLLGPVQLAAMSGMRRGEVFGLHRDDLDLDGGRVRVRRQLINLEHVPTLVDWPKSDHGFRTLDLDDETVAVLRRHLARQATTRLAVGPGWVDEGLVFADLGGGKLNPEKEAEKFNRRVAHVAVTRVRWHDLRHTHAALLLKAGVNVKVVSRRLGHASVSFTLDQYGHVMPDDDSMAAKAVGALVFGAVTNP